MIVLDTHVFLWYACDDARLSAQFKAELAADPHQVAVPTICLWEVLLLAEKGRIRLDSGDRGAAIKRYLEVSGFSEAPLTSEIAILSQVLEFKHDDPADRFIAATAYALGATLATSDERLRHLSWIKLAY